jgi:hypothetical protein
VKAGLVWLLWLVVLDALLAVELEIGHGGWSYYTYTLCGGHLQIMQTRCTPHLELLAQMTSSASL